LRCPGPQKRHDVGRATERIRDRLAAVEGQRRVEAASDLGDQHFAAGNAGAIKLRQNLNAVFVGRRGEPENEALCRVVLHSNS